VKASPAKAGAPNRMLIDLKGKVAIVTARDEVLAAASRPLSRPRALRFFAQTWIQGVWERWKPSSKPTPGARLVCMRCAKRRAGRGDGCKRVRPVRSDRHTGQQCSVSISGQIDRQNPCDWAANIETNLIGTFQTCHAAVPVMKRQRSGRILNAASFAAIVPSVGSSAYAASKAGVVSLRGFWRAS